MRVAFFHDAAAESGVVFAEGGGWVGEGGVDGGGSVGCAGGAAEGAGRAVGGEGTLVLRQGVCCRKARSAYPCKSAMATPQAVAIFSRVLALDAAFPDSACWMVAVDSRNCSGRGAVLR